MEFSKRKWGWYLTLSSRKYFKVKLLYFKKYGEISLQRHENRSEQWLFIFGNGLAKRKCPSYFIESMSEISGGDTFLIPIGYWHWYKARSRTLVLEIQVGLCEESDIERAA